MQCQSMSRHDSGWQPEGVETYDGFAVYDHGVWPNELNHGETDGDVSLTDE